MTDNVVGFPTTAQESAPETPVVDTSPEGLQRLVEQGTPQVLQLINRNRKEAIANLAKKLEQFELDLDRIRDNAGTEPLFVSKSSDGNVFFSLENQLRDLKTSLSAVSTGLEAHDSLLDMIVHDLTGLLQNVELAKHAAGINGNHFHTLATLLQEKGVISDEEMRATWDRLQTEQKEAVKQQLQEAEAAREVTPQQ